jgi:hypothetical protein
MNYIDKIAIYYNKIKDPKYIIEDWVIANDTLYNKLKNKLIITSIISHYSNDKEYTILCENKSKYYAIKYNNNFVCIRETDTEYGLAIGEYELLAVNKSAIYSKVPQETNEIILNIKDMCRLFNWKLGKKAKEYLDYFK